MAAPEPSRKSKTTKTSKNMVYFRVMGVIIHGDAAMAGQGVVW